MTKLPISLFVTCTLATAGAGASDTGDAIIQQARQDCQSFENGVLEITDNPISRVDLTGDGQPDELVDSRAFSCSSAASLFCGTGGCSLTAIVGGSTTEFQAKGWRIVDWDRQPILLLAVHGSECGGTNLRRCYNAMVWSESAFRSVGQ